jgi:hypothetical protein
VLNGLIGKMKRTLMGVEYGDTEIHPTPPSIPPQYVERSLEDPQPELQRQEELIKANKMRSLHDDWETLPRSVIDNLGSIDQRNEPVDAAKAAATARRLQRHVQSEFEDAPVTPRQPKSRELTMQEEMRLEKERKLAIKAEMASLVPVRRKPVTDHHG